MYGLSDGMSATMRPDTRRGPTDGQKNLRFLDDNARVGKRGTPGARLVAAAYRRTQRYLSGIGTPFHAEDADQLTRGRAWTVEPNWHPWMTQFADVLLANGCSTAAADCDYRRLLSVGEAVITMHRDSLHSIIPCSQDKQRGDAPSGEMPWSVPVQETKTASAGDDSARSQTVR